jgi:catechol 2,3-dioxygenase-like lactoylglutathione lyase family enzyme
MVSWRLEHRAQPTTEARRFTMAQNIAIERVDHIGVRVRNLDRALGFYRVLGFAVVRRAEADDVAIIRNEHGVELNLVFNANAGDPAANILMDVRDKYPGYTHIALSVASIPETVAARKRHSDRPGTSQLWRERADFCVCARP